jgi:hypothetical protein
MISAQNKLRIYRLLFLMLAAGAAYFVYFQFPASHVGRLASSISSLTPQGANIEQVKVGFRSKGVEFGEWLVPKTHPLVTYVNEVKIVAKPGQRVLYSKHPTGRTPRDEDLGVVLVFDEQDKLSSRYIGTSHVDWR